MCALPCTKTVVTHRGFVVRNGILDKTSSQTGSGVNQRPVFHDDGGAHPVPGVGRSRRRRVNNNIYNCVPPGPADRPHDRRPVIYRSPRGRAYPIGQHIGLIIHSRRTADRAAREEVATPAARTSQ